MHFGSSLVFAFVSISSAFVAQGRRKFDLHGETALSDSSASSEKKHLNYQPVTAPVKSLAAFLLAPNVRVGLAPRSRVGGLRHLAIGRQAILPGADHSRNKRTLARHIRQGGGRSLLQSPRGSSSALMLHNVPAPLPRKRIRKPKVSDFFVVMVVFALVQKLKRISGQFLVGFVSGGLFFSTVVAAFGAFYTFGYDNSQRARILFTQAFRRVWALVVSMLSAAWSVLLDPSKSEIDGDKNATRWTASVAILRDGIAQVRQAAAEGVEGIKLEANLYAAAIGQPGLVVIQYVLRRLTPFTVAGMMRDALSEALTTVDHPNVESLKLKLFDVGNAAPQLLAARLYDLGSEDMAFDIDIQWDSSLVAEIDVATKVGLQVGATIPVSVRKVRFNGPVRIIVTNLTAQAPGYGAFLVSLPRAPILGFDLRVAGGEVTRLPWLRGEIEKSIQNEVAEQYLWPNRMVVPATLPPEKELPTVLSKNDIALLMRDDPLLRLERALADQPVLKESLHSATAPQNYTENTSFNINFRWLANGVDLSNLSGTSTIILPDHGWYETVTDVTRRTWRGIFHDSSNSTDSHSDAAIMNAAPSNNISVFPRKQRLANATDNTSNVFRRLATKGLKVFRRKRVPADQLEFKGLNAGPSLDVAFNSTFNAANSETRAKPRWRRWTNVARVQTSTS